MTSSEKAFTVNDIHFFFLISIWENIGSNLALVVPGFPRLKEWVHAGIFFLMTGAALSHVFADDFGD